MVGEVHVAALLALEVRAVGGVAVGMMLHWRWGLRKLAFTAHSLHSNCTLTVQ